MKLDYWCLWRCLRANPTTANLPHNYLHRQRHDDAYGVYEENGQKRFWVFGGERQGAGIRRIDTPIEKIHELIEHRHQREIQMLELITSGKDSMDDIFNAIYKDIHPGLHNTARRQIQAHINKLVEEKRIEQTGNIYRIVQ